MSILEDREEMRRSGYRVVDAIVERLSELGDDKAFQTAPRDVTEALLDGPPPEEGRDLDPLLETVVRDVMPLAARIDHPRFLAIDPLVELAEIARTEGLWNHIDAACTAASPSSIRQAGLGSRALNWPTA